MSSKITGTSPRTSTVVRRTTLAGLVMIAALFSSSSLFAQRQMDTAAMRKRQEEMMQQLKSDLKLTDTQSDSVISIHRDIQSRSRAIFMDPSVSREDRRAKMEPLNEEREKRLKAALGDDLFKKYQAWMEAHRPQRGGGGRMQQ